MAYAKFFGQLGAILEGRPVNPQNRDIIGHGGRGCGKRSSDVRKQKYILLRICISLKEF